MVFFFDMQTSEMRSAALGEVASQFILTPHRQHLVLTCLNINDKAFVISSPRLAFPKDPAMAPAASDECLASRKTVLFGDVENGGNATLAIWR